MSAAYNAGQWGNFFVATASAAAALSGLVFVAVSMHLSHMVRQVHLRTGAGISLFAMLLTFVISVEVLVPRQRREVLGIEILATIFVWLALWARSTMKTRRTLGSFSDLTRRRMPYTYASFMLLLLGGIGTLTHRLGGLFLVAPGVVAVMLISVQNAWFFLTEIGFEEEEEEEAEERELEEIRKVIEGE